MYRAQLCRFANGGDYRYMHRYCVRADYALRRLHLPANVSFTSGRVTRGEAGADRPGLHPPGGDIRISGVTRVGVTFFPGKNCRPFLVITVCLSVVLQCHPCLFSRDKPTTFFDHHLITVTFVDFIRVSPPGACHPTPFSPIRPRLSTILCKFSHYFFFVRVSPP